MANDDNGIVRSQYSNEIGVSVMGFENSEKSEKKRDPQVEVLAKNLHLDDRFKEQRKYTEFMEQDVEAGYDMIDGVISTPSNLDMVDGLVDSDEEISSLASMKDYEEKSSITKNIGERHSVLEALEKKKEIVEQREHDRHLQDQELKRYQDVSL